MMICNLCQKEFKDGESVYAVVKGKAVIDKDEDVVVYIPTMEDAVNYVHASCIDGICTLHAVRYGNWISNDAGYLNGRARGFGPRYVGSIPTLASISQEK